jgi:hypothetical protein
MDLPMPSRPITIFTRLMLHDCCAVMASERGTSTDRDAIPANAAAQDFFLLLQQV